MSLAVSDAVPYTGLSSKAEYLLRTWRELDVPDGWRAEIIDDNGVVLVAPRPIRITSSQAGSIAHC